MTLLSTTTLSGSSTSISITPTGYNELIIYVESANPTNDVGIRMRINSDATAANYRNYISGNSGSVKSLVDNSTASVCIFEFPGTDGVKPSSDANSARIVISNPNLAKPKPIFSVGAFYSGSNVNCSINTTCNYTDNAAISSVQFLPNSGTFNSGTVKVYGVK